MRTKTNITPEEQLLKDMFLSDSGPSEPLVKASDQTVEALYLHLKSSEFGKGMPNAKTPVARRDAVLNMVDDLIPIFEDGDHGIPIIENLKDGAGYEDNAGNSKSGINVRSMAGKPRKQKVELKKDDHRQFPDRSRKYVGLKGMLRLMHLTYSPEHLRILGHTILNHLIRPEPVSIPLDTGGELPSNIAFAYLHHSSRLGSKKTCYAEVNTLGYLLDQLGIFPVLPDNRKHWDTSREFSGKLGRGHRSARLRELDAFLLYALLSGQPIPLKDGTEIMPEEVMGCYRTTLGSDFIASSGIKNEIVMYVDSEKLDYFVRQYLPCGPEGEQKNWLTARGLLLKMGIHTGGNTNMAMKQVLDDLYTTQGETELDVSGDNGARKRINQRMGKFRVAKMEEDAWLVDPFLVDNGIITPEMVTMKRKELAQHSIVTSQK